MAWRIEAWVVRGEIDNRTRGKVVGRIWLADRDEPVELDLKGNPWRDLAGHVLRFTNSSPQADGPGELPAVQQGVVGDMTASRKVKVPECSLDEVEELYAARKPIPYRWGNALYLEWFSEKSGRVVVESAGFQLEIEPEAAWRMTVEEESAQRLANGQELTDFMQRLGMSVPGNAELGTYDFDDDEPQSKAEAEADEEAARMDLLLDRVEARLEREGFDEETYDRIYEEERRRLRRERGEPEEEELTPEQEAEREAWVEEMNAIAADVEAELEAEKWKGTDRPEPRRPVLVERASDFAIKVHVEIREGEWVSEEDQREHPLFEIINGTMSASAKLAGALGMGDDDEEWPPPPIFAGDKLVRLKKARGYLRDVLAGLDCADQQQLATPEWRASTRRETAEVFGEVQKLIVEVREVLKKAEE